MTSATNRLFAFVLAALLSAAFNVFWAGLGFGATFTSFGPRVYERSTGNPTPVVTSFATAHSSKPHTLRISNGGRTGIRTGERVSSAVITLNGAVVAGSQNLNDKLGEISLPVKLLPSNQLSVELRGRPGGLLIVEFLGVNNLPIANAGQDQTLFVGNTAQLDGSASSDVDGDLLSFEWSFESRPVGSSATLVDPTAVKPHFLVDRPGNYQLRLTVNDGLANGPPDTVTISTLNSRPVAYAGLDQTVPLNAQTLLDGRDSGDVDGDQLSYRWRIVSKPSNSGAVLQNPNTSQPNFITDKPGSYVIELIVNDGTVDSIPDQVVITTENSRPVADAGQDINAFVGDIVRLDGIYSSDADNDLLTYQWSFTSRPIGSTALLSVPTIVNPTFVPDLPGLYVVQLIVSDGKVNSLPDTAVATITVFVPPNRNPVALNDTALTAQNTPVTITVLGNDSDPDGDPISITGVTQGANGTVTTNGTTTTYTPKPDFHGIDSFTYAIADNRGGTAQATVTVVVDQAPIVNAGPDQTITLPATASLNGAVTDDGLPNPPGSVTTQWAQTSGTGTVTFGSALAVKTTATFSQAGTYVLRLSASDGFLSASSFVTVTVNPIPPAIPPDPVVLAPPLDMTVPTTLDKATEFLYSGINPIQTGVAPGTIVANRAAVIRGRVLDRSNTPLSGVTITILNHPEFGQTVSREDGVFDMAVNGGGPLTVDYKKSGLLPVQRQVRTSWQDFSIAPDIVMIARDSQVTTVALNANVMQVARGTSSSDSDGNRQATILIPPGTQAQIYRPDGATQSVDVLNLRLTEYTVGANGPNAMPGELPPNSGYTYAVELGADEATTKIGGKDVLLTQPVFFYLENFIGFPIGENVPTGFYDNDRSAWVASDNGRVVRIIGLSGGLANLDTNGDGIADNDAALGITNAERQQLAMLYQPGQSLWRVPLTHLSTWDSNWGVEPDCDPETESCTCTQETFDAENKTIIKVKCVPMIEQQMENACTQGGNSVIECQNQVLTETLGLVGTGITLNYRSERVPEVEIPLSGPTIPSGLKNIQLEIKVAGREFRQTFPPLANQRTTFTWDGKDAYGRRITGAVPITGRLGYTFDAKYQQTGAFGYNGNGQTISGQRGGGGLTIWSTWSDQIPVWDNRGVGVGGWTLSAHHTFDPRDNMLHRGNGTRQGSKGIGPTISTIAGPGGGTACEGGDGAAATQASLCPEALAVGPDGSLYIATPSANRVRRVAVDGTITTVAGTGAACSSATGPCGDGGQATSAQLSRPFSVAIGPDGSLYLGELDSRRVRRVGRDGVITTVAGSGVACTSATSPCGDGGPARLAQLAAPFGLAVAPDGSLFIVDQAVRRLRRVGPDGIISTVAGTGIACASPTAACGDNGPATLADLTDPRAITIGLDGSLYISDRGTHRLRRITPDGIIRTVAGTGQAGFEGDGGLATEARLNNPNAVAMGADDTIYVIDESNRRIRWLRPGGIINTLAGNGSSTSSGDGGPALKTGFRELGSALSVAPDGRIYVAEPGTGGVVRRLALTLDGLAGGGFAVPSEDGSVLHLFNQAGRHLQTIDAFTNAQQYVFGYDKLGRLISVTDQDANITAIERDGSGNATAIIAPFGQRTTLATNSDGYLSRVTNPAGESAQMSYTPEGWMTSFTNPRGFTSSYGYDINGRLTGATDPAGATKTLVRSGTNLDRTVQITTALGRKTFYRVQRQENKDIRLTNVDPSGAITSTLIAQDGRRTTNFADGSTVDMLLVPDPRWGMSAPFAQTMTTATPGGKVQNTSTLRTVIVDSLSDPFSLKTFTETSIVNGRVFISSFDAASRTFTQTSPMGRQTKSIVDGKGRPIQAQTAGLEPVNYEYDVRGRVKVVTQGTGIASRTTNFTYNNAGFLETITDPLGRMMRFNYDAAGRVIEQITPDNRSIISAYDANGNATGVIPPGRPAHTFSYTPVDLTSIYTPPDIGPGSEATVNTFNADRQLTRVALPNGQNMDLGFDGASGRLTNVTIARGQINYGYVASSGNLASVSAPDETQTFTYDGSLPTLMRWTGAVPGEVNRSYDNNFRTTTEVLSGTDTVSFQYDNDDLLIGAGSLTLTRNSQNGRVTTTTLGNVTDSFGYSSFGEMTSYSAAFAGLSVYSAQYARDNLGRIIQKTEMIGGVTDTFNYSYDLAGRLTEVRKNGSVTSTYTYDANGNRLSGPSATTTYTYDDQDRLLATTNTSAMFTLPVGRQIEYLVDGRNRRIGKKINGTIVQKFLYSGRLTPIAELDGNNNLISRFVYSTGANVPAYMIKGGTTYRIITDHLGSPRLIINVSTGLVVQRMDYDEFGNVTNDTNPSFQPFGFAGGLYDSDAKFVRFGARDYDSRMGRWIAKDPIGLDGGDTNLYSYVFNEPINHTDPLGMVGVPDWFIKACEKAGVATELIEELWGRLYGTFKHNLRPMIGTGGGLTLFLQRLGWSARYLPQLGCISTELLFFLGRVSLIVGYVAVLDWQTEQVEPEVRATLERNREAGIPGLTIMDSIRLRGR